MNFFKRKTKKIFTLSAIALSLATPAFADDGGNGNIEALLTLIWKNTVAILGDVDSLPNYVANWINPDTSSGTATIQGYFSNASQGYIQEYVANVSNQQSQFMKDFLGADATATSFPNANDLTYQTLMGTLYFNPDPRKNSSVDPAYNYAKYAAGLNITHARPMGTWRGKSTAIQQYNNYYNSVMAVQSFNAWVMGQAYSNYKTGFPFEKQQWNLIAQASNSNWFQEVASENIGVVLRQILMYDSQILVALTQLLQTQREQLTAQAMTNTLLVLSNQTTENYLAKDAQGALPGS